MREKSATDCVVKRHAHYLGFQFDKQIFTQLAEITSLEHHSITMGVNQSKTLIANLLTSSVSFA